MNRRELLASLVPVLPVPQLALPPSRPPHNCDSHSTNLGGIAVWNDADPDIPIVQGYPSLRLMLCKECDRLWVRRLPEEKER